MWLERPYDFLTDGQVFAIDQTSSTRVAGWRNWLISLPFDLPLLLLESLVDRLSDGRFHQIDVSHHLRGERISQMLVEAAVFQIVCVSIKAAIICRSVAVWRTQTHRPSADSRWEFGTRGTNPRCRAAARPARRPCRRRRRTRRSRRVPPVSR